MGFSASFDFNLNAELDAVLGSSTLAVTVPIYSPSAVPLTAGTSIGASSQFSGTPLVPPTKTLAYYYSTSNGGGTEFFFSGVQNAYLGLSFTDPNNSKQTDYGYVGLSVTGDSSPSVTATLNSFAYDNTGAAIVAGATSAVPEPSSLLIAALGAAGMGAFLAWRRRVATSS